MVISVADCCAITSEVSTFCGGCTVTGGVAHVTENLLHLHVPVLPWAPVHMLRISPFLVCASPPTCFTRVQSSLGILCLRNMPRARNGNRFDVTCHVGRLGNLRVIFHRRRLVCVCMSLALPSCLSSCPSLSLLWRIMLAAGYRVHCRR